jgi:hypothetical protein
VEGSHSRPFVKNVLLECHRTTMTELGMLACRRCGTGIPFVPARHEPDGGIHEEET